jgi:hypothetical protein
MADLLSLRITKSVSSTNLVHNLVKPSSGAGGIVGLLGRAARAGFCFVD